MNIGKFTNDILLDTDGQLIRAESFLKSVSDTTGREDIPAVFCPHCLKELRYVKQSAPGKQERRAHFRHSGGQGEDLVCAEKREREGPRKWEMSDFHREWQNFFRPELREITIRGDKVNSENNFRRADIATSDGSIVEIQNSPISQHEIVSRCLFYAMVGLRLLWVFNGQSDAFFTSATFMRLPCGLLLLQGDYNKNRYRFCVKSRVFIDTGCNHLIEVFPEAHPGYLVCQLISLQDFEALFPQEDLLYRISNRDTENDGTAVLKCVFEDISYGRFINRTIGSILEEQESPILEDSYLFRALVWLKDNKILNQEDIAYGRLSSICLRLLRHHALKKYGCNSACKCGYLVSLLIKECGAETQYFESPAFAASRFQVSSLPFVVEIQTHGDIDMRSVIDNIMALREKMKQEAARFCLYCSLKGHPKERCPYTNRRVM